MKRVYKENLKFVDEILEKYDTNDDEYFETKRLIEEIKKINKVTVNKVDIFFNDDYWVFPKSNNEARSKRVIDFRKYDEDYIELLKIYAIIRILEGEYRLKRIAFNVSTANNLLVFLKDKGISELDNIPNDIVMEYIEGLTTGKKEKVLGIKDFMNFYNCNINSSFDEILIMHINEILKFNYSNTLKERTPDIDRDFFNASLSLAIEIMNYSAADNYIQGIAAMYIIASQIGLRTGELFQLKVGCLNEIVLSNNEKGFYIKYEAYKGRHGTFARNSQEIVYANRLVERAYTHLLEIYREERKRLGVNWLFVGAKTTLKTNYPVDSSLAGLMLKELFAYFVEYIKLKKYNSSNDIMYYKIINEWKEINPTFTKLRVHMCSELYRAGYQIEYIETFMSHLAPSMALYYARPKKGKQENIEYSTKVLKDILLGRADLIGPNKGMSEKINEFIDSNNYNVVNDIDEICRTLLEKIPIRQKLGGVCIKSSMFRECSMDAQTNELYCAYGVCPNIYTFYYMIDDTLKRCNELVENYTYNNENGFIKQKQKDLNMLNTLINTRLEYQYIELKERVSTSGTDKIIADYPNIKMYVESLDEVGKRIEEWKQMIKASSI